MTKTKEAPTKTTYQGREYQILPAADKNVTHQILQFKDRLRPHQAIVAKTILEGLKEEKTYILTDGKQEYKRGSYPLCKTEQGILEKQVQHKATKFKIIENGIQRKTLRKNSQ